MEEVLRRLLAVTAGTFIDVGVNLGQTLLKVAAIDPDRVYLGFEPNPMCVAYVQKLIEINGLDHHTVIPAGLAPSPGLAVLELYEGETDSSASIVPGFRPARTPYGRKVVAVLSMKEIPSDFIPATVGVVKIDVEGAEADVVESLLPLLREKRPILLLEVLPCYDEARENRIRSQHRIERQLKSLNYSLRRIMRRSDGSYSHTELVEQIGIHSDLQMTDYIAMPVERPFPL